VLGRGAKAIPAAEADPQALANLLAEEAAATRALYAVLTTRLEDDARLADIYETIERPLLLVLARMEAAGVAVDAFRLARQSEEMSVRIDGLVKQAYELAGHDFNLSSPRQLAQVLFAEQGMPVKKKTSSGTPSTDEEVLTELAADYPLPKVILEHRRLTKLQGTYLDKLPKMVDPADGRVHTTFSQAVAVTGRLASADPNLQNIPVRTEEGRRVREAFVGENGRKIVSADYSQIELRIMAHLSQDKELLAAFARGEDIHRSTAARVFGKKIEDVTPEERRMAKVINFGLIYGMSAFGLAQNLGIDRHVAASYIDQYFERYPDVRRYMEQKRMEARERGYVETAFGRRLWLPDIRSSRKMVQAAAERQAINAPMQGTAADLIKKAMIGVDRWLREKGLASKLILQVHDELILEVPPEEVETVKKGVAAIMADAGQLSVPLIAEVGVGDSWEEAH
jgi:DNA polymerase-1